MFLAIFSLPVSAQSPTVIRTADGKTITTNGPMPAPGGRPPGGPPPGSKPDGKDGEKKEGNGGEGKPPESAAPKVIRRDSVEAKSSDPSELKATVGDDGKVGFRFRNQGWVDLVRWLSDISEQPIDWQELPGDTVNLISPDRLTVSQTADLINRHLLARGYTMLDLEGGIAIVKTDAVNPGMVRRVDASELNDLEDHRYVRTMLDAGWLSAEKLSEELKAMLSSAGKMIPLATTNRIEVMDVAVNLRQVAHLLAEERDAASRDALAPEFRLRHIPAEEAKSMLEQFLGVEKKDSAPMSQQQMQMMQRMQQMQQQQGKKGGDTKGDVEISIVANTRQNSVLVRAPLDRVAIAAEFIKRIDVPGGSLRSLTDATSRVDVFRLVSLDPEKLIEIAQEMNVLEPTTRIRVDKDNSAVIVSGSAADRFIIKSLIERLDGGKRRLEVLQLRRLGAAEVAESISFLMGQEPEEDDNNSRSRYSYYGWGGNDDDDDKDKDKFRVTANVAYRQVLLWANETEMEEVRSLLIKLGELPPPGGSERTMRIIEASATPETLEYLQRLQRRWQQLSGTELVLPDADEFKDPIDVIGEEREEEDTKTEDEDSTEETEEAPAVILPPETELTGIGQSQEQLTWVNAFSDDNAAADLPNQESSPATDRSIATTTNISSKPASSKPKIEIKLDAAGNLILRSDDTDALDQLEDLMLQVSPPRRPYHVFRIRYASVVFIADDLEDYFEEDEEDEEDDSDRFYRYIFGSGDSEDKGPKGLDAAGKLKFLPNSDTGTLIVSGATGQQLQTIEELIRLWDVPETVNPRRVRYTKLVHIQYGSAAKIAETVKDAYRDLLSSNDKAFQAGGGGGKRGGAQSASNRESGSGLEDSESGKDGGGQDFSFNGKLSMGVDEVGNTLLISAEGESLLDLIAEMVDKLDVAAKPGGDVEIINLSGGVSAEAVQRALAALGVESDARPSRDRNSNSDDRRRDNNDSPRRRPSRD
ncbi:secretin N-terminal domain-containing protein [Rhodopirellula europaea]|jgi:type II secretory pathway component GspD/PulD (secretin)|uniref:NolW domain protein n=1 Tax=Rhodopirellula europaea SH398 TaxID=1263868 RepID=M5S553_9BACT|nr:secretin N-terminal domain-containing protein [Rhodopirellula europaea]EMI26601.1 NolW domain protein [Rhodopirellula europaea SH398]